MKDLITGVVKSCDNQPIAFSAEKEDYRFCFMSTNTYQIGQKNEEIALKNQDGFIWGKTHDNHGIAIFVGDIQIALRTVRYLNTSAYVVSCSNLYDYDISEFDAICFSGKTLNQVFFKDALEMEVEEGKTIFLHKDDTLKYRIQTQKYDMELSICSTVGEGWGVNGHFIKNEDVVLQLSFDKPQPLRTIFEHYNKIKDMLSFMTFRKNVGFENIYLLQKDTRVNAWDKCADVYIKEEQEVTSKNLILNLCFEDIEEEIPALVGLLYDTEDKKPSYSLGFYPQNDQDISWMNDQKLRAICSALECEIGFDEDIKSEEKQLLTALTEETRALVKSFREKNPGLSNDTYNGIYSNIKNWSLPLAEKLWALYCKYEYEMLQLYNTRFRIKEKNIRNFVKYRNDITHGSHRVMDKEIFETAFYLMGLVYCCLLSRIGVSRERIREFCRNKILR